MKKNEMAKDFFIYGDGIWDCPKGQRGEFWEERSFLNTQFWGKLKLIIIIL
jgi:hypothetical protein